VLERGAHAQSLVVAEAGDGAAVVEHGLRDEIDLAVLDLSMPKLAGLQAAASFVGRRRTCGS
jgi:DNA-binding response OmpR family regulator